MFVGPAVPDTAFVMDRRDRHRSVLSGTAGPPLDARITLTGSPRTGKGSLVSSLLLLTL